MPGFTLLTSNRLERLAQTLAMRTRLRAADPFAREIIVIQSRGMERWLAFEIARHNGIAANLDFPFPEAFLQTVMAAILPAVPAESAFRREAMTFGIDGLLARNVANGPEFAPLRSYLRNDSDGVRRFQLAEQIAFLFDQYLVFRPDMMLAWDEGRMNREDPHQCWQALLWRELTRGAAGGHRARLWQFMRDRLQAAPAPPPGLSRRVSVFGISYLPPFYLQALAALSRVMTVDLYQLNPCREYWADIVSQGEGKRLQRGRQEGLQGLHEDDLHLEEGNRLLASLGAQGRTFHRLVIDFDPLVEEDFGRIPGDTLLAAVQNDILNLREGSFANGSEPHRREDGSIQVHACHSPMREIEVLYDQVLDLLNADNQLTPRDIMVLTPDIDTYAPYVQAVFGAPEDESQRLPFSIADRSPLQSRPSVEAFLFLLDLKQSRFPASEILTLLEVPAIRSRFDFTAEDVRLVGTWLAETRIRWGADAASKAHLGLPPTGENTWQAGLDRLLMGYALPAERGELFRGILPAGGGEGSQAEALGHLVRFVDRLRHWQERLTLSHLPQEWALHLTQLADDFFRPGLEEENDLLLMRRLMADLRRHSAAAGADAPVGVEVIRSYLKRRLEGERSGGGFIAGGITFGALLPMRSIPAKVVCLVGMNQDAFPRDDRPLGFDLIAATPRAGDRSRRHDDRYLFLEAIVSARTCLYISYVGHDIQDNAVRPPSVVVSELLDYLVETCGLPEDALVTHHPLQPFSPDYFLPEKPRLFSFSRQNREAAKGLATGRARAAAPEAFMAAPLAAWEAEDQVVDIRALARALSHPCRFLLEKRLQVRLQEYESDASDRESFLLEALDRYQLGQDLVDMLVSADSSSCALEKARAAGRLPHGNPGQTSFEEVLREAEDIAAAVRALQAGRATAAGIVEIRIPPYTLTGRLDAIFPTGQVAWRFGRARGPDLLAAWLRHLLWCRTAFEAPACVTTLVAGDGQRRFAGVARPDELLNGLLEHYRSAGSAPVPLFPHASWEYAVLRFEKGCSAGKALERVRAGWRRTFGWPGESEDPYIRCCFPDGDPLDDAFVAMTEAVYGPMMRHSEKA